MCVKAIIVAIEPEGALEGHLVAFVRGKCILFPCRPFPNLFL